MEHHYTVLHLSQLVYLLPTSVDPPLGVHIEYQIADFNPGLHIFYGPGLPLPGIANPIIQAILKTWNQSHKPL